MLDTKGVRFWGERDAKRIIFQLVDEHDAEMMEAEMNALRGMVSSSDWCLITLPVGSWNEDLTAWRAPAVFGKQDFGEGAEDTLTSLLAVKDELFPGQDKEFILGGYSLAGLFALWAGYQTDAFSGLVAASPSVWYPGWLSFIEEHRMQVGRVYLSLGDKEEKARNPVMARVGDAIRTQHEALVKEGKDTILTWNPGNHFKESEIRLAKGFAWMLEGVK